MKKTLKESFKQGKILKSKELVSLLGSRTAIQRLVKKGELFTIGQGYYSDKPLSLFHFKILILSTHYPDAIVSGKAALFLHGFLKEEPEEVEVTIENSKSLKNSLFNVKRTITNNLADLIIIKYKRIAIKTFPLEKVLVLISKQKSSHAFLVSLNQKKNKTKINKENILNYDLDYKTNVYDVLFSDSTSSNQSKSTNDNKKMHAKIIDIGYDFYVENGFQGVTMQMIADKMGISKDQLNSHFKSKMVLKSAIFARESDKLLNQGYELNIPGIEKMSPEQIAQLIIQGTLKNIDTVKGEKEFRFQNWAMLENHPIVGIIVKECCSKAISMIAGLIQSAVKISNEEAEIRASVLVAAIDSYIAIRWKYISGLEICTSKSQYLTNYKQYMIHDLVGLAFKK